jgi:hypothetical protein
VSEALVLDTERVIENEGHGTNVTVDHGTDDNATALHYADAGDDSLPLKDDWAQLVPGGGTGNMSAVGYADVKCEPKAGKGEKRIYSRSGPGVVAMEAWLKADGSLAVEGDGPVTIKTSGGTFEIAKNGDVTMSGNLKVKGEITAMADTPAAVKLSSHLHSTAMGPSGPPTPGT